MGLRRQHPPCIKASACNHSISTQQNKIISFERQISKEEIQVTAIYSKAHTLLILRKYSIDVL